jgi:hypothetical protein
VSFVDDLMPRAFFSRSQRLIGTIEVASREVPTKFPLSLVTDLSRPSRDARGRRRRDGPAPGGVFVAGAARVAGRPAGAPDILHEPAEGTATREIRGHGHPFGGTRLVPPVSVSRFVIARVSLVRLTSPFTHPLPAPFVSAQVSIVEVLREEQERAARAEKARAASHSGASRDVGGADAHRRRSDARSALRTHREENIDDDDAANANGSPRAHQAKLWNEEELEHVMEDVAVSARGEHFFFFFFRVRGAHFRFFFLAPPETVARR